MTSKIQRNSFISNDGFIWTNDNPDLELIEPPMLVSCNNNYLQFSRNLNRPPEKRTLRIANHGDYPVAFKIQTTDNYSYFVDQVCGVIPGRRTVTETTVRMLSMVSIQVYHRPYSCYPDDEQCKYHNTPRKDKLFILLAPLFNPLFDPASVFHEEKPYEKLRVLLHYTGLENKHMIKVKQLLIRGIKGWCTWEEIATTKAHMDEMNNFKALHQQIIVATSREVIKRDESDRKNKAISKKTVLPKSQNTSKGSVRSHCTSPTSPKEKEIKKLTRGTVSKRGHSAEMTSQGLRNQGTKKSSAETAISLCERELRSPTLFSLRKGGASKK